MPAARANVTKRTSGDDRVLHVEMCGISRRFGHVQANHHVDLDLAPGEVHALLGENGAGKSTLMAILSGLETADAGTIRLNGQTARIDSPATALSYGIGIVHQEFRLFEGLSVAENLLLGWKGAPAVFRSRSGWIRKAEQICNTYGIDLDPAAKVWQLSVGQKQWLEILRLLVRDAKLLLLDEPTAVLSPPETAALLAFIRDLREDKRAVVFITHKLQEAIEAADRISVMRGGRLVASLSRDEADVTKLATLMVGGQVERARRNQRDAGAPVLRMESVTARDDRGLTALKNINLTVREGEIVGVAGVGGNGQRELTEVLAGTRRPVGGEIWVGGTQVTGKTPLFLTRAGLGVVPEDRKGTGLAPDAPIWMNAVLRRYRDRPVGWMGIVKKRRAMEFAQDLARRVRLSTEDTTSPVAQLSGGHSQRLLVGREIEVATQALVLAYPTRGLDISAVERVRLDVLEARQNGVGVLMISEDLDEIFELADQVVVLYEGEIAGKFDAWDADLTVVGELMAGVTQNIADVSE